MWLLSRKKPKQKTTDVLEGLEKQIKDTEDRSRARDMRQRRARRALLLYGVLLSIPALLWFYLHRDSGNLIHAVPLIAVPATAYTAAIIVGVCYSHARAADEAKKAELRASMEAKLDELRKETDFDRTQQLIQRLSTTATPHKDDGTAASTSAAATATPMQGRTLPAVSAGTMPFASPLRTTAPQTPMLSTPMQSRINPMQQQQQPVVVQALPPPTPAAATAQSKSWLDRTLDVLVGGEHTDSFALICGRCGYHNGFVPTSEFEGARALLFASSSTHTHSHLIRF